MAKILQRGRLIAGVSADTYLLAARNPINGQIEGFDIDMVKAIARAIFGDDKDRVTLRVISASDRIPVLQKHEVDIVARNMTINCTRWRDIAFSAEYYRSGQKLLVRKESKIRDLSTLASQRVCAPVGTSSIDNIVKLAPKAKDFTNKRAYKNRPLTEADKATNRRKSSVRAKVEHPFLVLKRLWGFAKVRYRGLAKNRAQLFTLFGLANLLIAKRSLFALHAQGAS